MQPGALSTSAVQEPAVEVTVAGIARDALTVTIDRELSTDLPGQVIGGGAVAAATGSATLAPRHPLEQTPPDPWSTRTVWPPRAGQTVTVDVGTNGSTWRQLTGIIDGATGSLGSGEVATKLVDQLDSLRRVINLDVRLPPADGYRDTALARLAAVLSYGGYSAGAVPDDSTLLYVPLLAGSTVPAVGADSTVHWSDLLDDGTPDITWGPAAWGTGARFTNTYPYWSVPRAVTGLGVHELVFDVDLTTGMSGADAWLSLVHPGSEYLLGALMQASAAINTDQLGHPAVRFSAGSGAGSSAWINLPDDLAVARVVLRATVDAAGRMTVRGWAYDATGPAPSATAPLWTSPTFTPTAAGGAAADYRGAVTVGAGFSRSGATIAAVCGVRVARYATAPTTLPTGGTNLHVNVGAGTLMLLDCCPLEVSPSVYARTALEVAQEIAAATLASMWLDEHGIMQVWGRNAMRYRPIVATVTSSRSLLELTWASDTSGVAHSVTLERETPTVTTSPGTTAYGQTIYVAPDMALAPGDTYSEIIHPEDGVDWIDPDPYLSWPWTIPADDIPARDGSWIGRSNEDGSPTNNSFTCAVKRLDARSLLYTIKADPTNSGRVVNRFDDTFAAASLRGAPSPIFRARGTVAWAADRVTVPAGPDWAPDLTHDGGRWLQRTDFRDYGVSVAADIAAQLATGTPAVESLDIIPDPRIQLGDRITVVDDYRSGVSLDAIVAGISLSVSGAEITQSLKLRVLSATSRGVLIGDLDDVWSDTTLSALDAHWAGKTIADLDANPLDR